MRGEARNRSVLVTLPPLLGGRGAVSARPFLVTITPRGFKAKWHHCHPLSKRSSRRSIPFGPIQPLPSTLPPYDPSLPAAAQDTFLDVSIEVKYYALRDTQLPLRSERRNPLIESSGEQLLLGVRSGPIWP